jgi:hypothetical protein
MDKQCQLVTYWKEYLQTCVSSQAGEVQLLETRKAFYAGALALSNVLRFIGDNYPPSEWAAQSKAVHEAVLDDVADFTMPPTLGGMQ